MVDTPLDQLLRSGKPTCGATRQSLRVSPGSSSPPRRHGRCWRSWRASIRLPDGLLEAFRADFDGLISFIDTHQIITVPAARNADTAGDAAVPACDYLRIDGHARPVRIGGD
jgi:hypothetical protein